MNWRWSLGLVEVAGGFGCAYRPASELNAQRDYVVAVLPSAETLSVAVSCDVVFLPGQGLQARVTILNRASQPIFVLHPTAYSTMERHHPGGYVAAHGSDQQIWEVRRWPDSYPDPLTELSPGMSSTQAVWMWQGTSASPGDGSAGESFRCAGRWWDTKSGVVTRPRSIDTAAIWVCPYQHQAEQTVICGAPE